MVREFLLDGCKAIEFDSLSDHACFINSHKNDTSLKNVRDMSDGSADYSFRGCSSYDELIDKMVNGDDKATASFMELSNYSPETGQDNSNYFMDIEGCAYDMGSVVSGEPECCLNYGGESVKPMIKIFVDQGYAGYADVETIQLRSVGIVNLVNTLITQGYIIELVIGNYERETRIYCMTKINTDMLCISEVAVATSPYYWRVGGWLTTEVVNKGCQPYTYGCSTMSKGDIDKLKKDGWMYIGGGYTDNRMNSLSSVEEANNVIQSIFKDYINQRVEK